MPKHYTVEPDRTDSLQAWDIIHTPSGRSVQPFAGPLARKLTKRDCEHIARYAEKVAPYEDVTCAAQKLQSRQFIQKLRSYTDSRCARVHVSQQFPI